MRVQWAADTVWVAAAVTVWEAWAVTVWEAWVAVTVWVAWAEVGLVGAGWRCAVARRCHPVPLATTERITLLSTRL
jgi:hypothetical protein